MGFRGALLGLFLVTALFAGCIGSTDEDPIATAGATRPAASAVPVEYACLEGASEERVPGVCSLRLSEPERSYQEPFVALHPTDPGTIVVGVNAGDPTTDATASPLPRAGAMVMDLLVSEDSGASWTVRTVPAPATGGMEGVSDVAHLVGDPSFAFDDTGRLHLSGIYIPAYDGRPTPQTIFYTSTDDLGASWTDPVLLKADGEQDRNWLTLAPDGSVWVAWHNYISGTSDVAWSTDAGASWPEGQRIHLDDCATPSPVQFPAEGPPWLLCRPYDGSPGQVVGLDPADATARVINTVAVDGYFALAAIGAGGSWHGMSKRGSLVLYSSNDDGATWEGLDLADLVSVDDNWAWTYVSWLEADPWGGIHILLEGGSEQGECRGPTCLQGETHAGQQVAHVAVDARTGALLQEQILTPEPSAPMSGSAAPQWYDDFAGLAFDADHGVMAWHVDKGVELTRIEPVPAAA